MKTREEIIKATDKAIEDGICRECKTPYDVNECEEGWDLGLCSNCNDKKDCINCGRTDTLNEFELCNKCRDKKFKIFFKVLTIECKEYEIDKKVEDALREGDIEMAIYYDMRRKNEIN